MEKSTITETLKTSLFANIWAERLFIIYFILVTVIGIYVHASVFEFFELLLFSFLFFGIAFLGFVAITAHIRYYFHYELRRKIELFADKMVIKVKDKVMEQLLKNDILRLLYMINGI